MTIRRLCSIAAVFCAALVLSGCYVISTVAPATGGFDERLFGAWTGLNEKGKVEPGHFLHFIKGAEGKPARMVMISSDEISVYEVRTLAAGANRAFALKNIMTDKGGEFPEGYLLGYYEIRGDRLAIRILDSDLVGALVDSGKVKGTKTTGQYFDVTLTGSPGEIAAFLASPEAFAATGPKALPFARRLPQPR